MSPETFTGEKRCWPCTVANSVVGLLVAWVPFAAAIAEGSTALLVGTAVWGTVVTGYTGYRLTKLGYLPLAEPVAKLARLHDRIGLGSKADVDSHGDK